jgi:hypothetical protein
MSKVILDPDLKARLNGLDQHLEICDTDGRTLGHFLPAGEYWKLLYRSAEADCPYTEEELQRMQAEAGGRTLVEVWKALEQT